MSLRNWLYDNSWLKQISVDRPVISVGNLTFGGTGKTPFVQLLLEYCKIKNIAVGVVSRGYKRQSTGVLEVQSSDSLRYGDEPSLIKKTYPNAIVYVGSRRVEAAQNLIATYPKTQLIIADDAFQHRNLKRNLDIVLIDSSKPLWHLRPFPFGLGRESLAGLERAHFLVLTRAELNQNLSPQIKFKGTVIECKTKGQPLRYLGSSKPFLKLEKLMAVSAIGNPQSFEKNLNLPLVGVARFSDHYSYKQSDIDRLEKSESFFVTTEKDEVKIQKLKFDSSRWAVLPIRLNPSDAMTELYEEIDRLILSRD